MNPFNLSGESIPSNLLWRTIPGALLQHNYGYVILVTHIDHSVSGRAPSQLHIAKLGCFHLGFCQVFEYTFFGCTLHELLTTIRDDFQLLSASPLTHD